MSIAIQTALTNALLRAGIRADKTLFLSDRDLTMSLIDNPKDLRKVNKVIRSYSSSTYSLESTPD